MSNGESEKSYSEQIEYKKSVLRAYRSMQKHKERGTFKKTYLAKESQ